MLGNYDKETANVKFYGYPVEGNDNDPPEIRRVVNIPKRINLRFKGVTSNGINAI